MFETSRSNQNRLRNNESLEIYPPPGTEIDSMLKILTELRESGYFCDVTLNLDGGETFRAHRACLAASSPFFRALFSFTEDQTINLPYISMPIMKLILQYCYTRRCQIDESNVEGVLSLADRLIIPGLKERCCDFLASQLCAQNCVGIWRFARFYFCNNLAERCYRFLLKKIPEVSSVSDEWLHLKPDEIVQICKEDALNCKREEEVFSSIYRWLAFDPSRQKNEHFVADLFRTVRLGLLSVQFLRDVIESNPIVATNPPTFSLYLSSYRRRLIKPCNDGNITPYFSRLRIPHEVLFAIGGWTGRNPNDVIETYDVRAKRWRILDVKIDQGPRAYQSCVLLDGQVYVVGGYNGNDYFNSVRKWNPINGAWQEVAPMNSRRCYVSAVTLNGKIIACGGFDGNVRMNTAEMYNPATNQWSLIKPMNDQRSDAGAAVLNGLLYICGGFNGTTCLDTVERYDPVTDHWTNVASMASRRSGVSVVVHCGYLYALGGFNGSRRVGTVERYCPSLDAWRLVAPMKTPRSNFATGVIDDELIVMGGYHDGSTMAKVETYDFSSNRWTEAAEMTKNRSALSAVVLQDLPNICQYLCRDDDDDGYGTEEGEDAGLNDDEEH